MLFSCLNSFKLCTTSMLPRRIDNRLPLSTQEALLDGFRHRNECQQFLPSSSQVPLDV